jgi:HSP20 family protein
MQQSHDLQGLRGSLNRVFEDTERGDTARLWAPAVDVAESDQEIVLYAELPGMSREEIDIQLTGDMLTLRGERALPQVTRGEHYHRIERQYGPWQRAFQIEVPIDQSRVSASYEEGVLTVRLPKREEIKPRQIPIEVK